MSHGHGTDWADTPHTGKNPLEILHETISNHVHKLQRNYDYSVHNNQWNESNKKQFLSQFRELQELYNIKNVLTEGGSPPIRSEAPAGSESPQGLALYLSASAVVTELNASGTETTETETFEKGIYIFNPTANGVKIVASGGVMAQSFYGTLSFKLTASAVWTVRTSKINLTAGTFYIKWSPPTPPPSSGEDSGESSD